MDAVEFLVVEWIPQDLARQTNVLPDTLTVLGKVKVDQPLARVKVGGPRPVPSTAFCLKQYGIVLQTEIK